jgi:hypothetical protein
VLGQSLNERENTSLGVEPSICSKLLLEWFKTLGDTADSEVVVALGTIEGTNDQVHNTEMEHLLGGLFDGNAILFLLDTLHELLSISVLTCHDVGDAKVGKDDGSDLEEVIHLSSDEGLIVSDGLSVLVVLHEEYMGNVELPSFVL